MSKDQDPLQLLSLERWSELQGAFKEDWPRGISGHIALEIQRQWRAQCINYDFKVYCPFGDVQNGMVAFNIKDTFNEIIIQCPNDNTEKLAEALKKTKIIDWNKETIVPYVHSNVIECLRNALHDIGVDLTVHRFLETFILEQADFGDLSLPPNITFGPITLEHLDFVDLTWPNRYAGSKWHFELLINTKSGYGLFLNNKLISWIFFKEVGPLQHLYTVEEHRKKGYGELLLKLASEIWLKEGKPVIAFCFTNNTGACKLYKKAGFMKSEQVAWCYINEK